MQARAPALDTEEAFPGPDIAALTEAGLLEASYTEPLPLHAVLRLLGAGNLSVGRLFEAHVNAALLVARYGTSAVQAQHRRDVVSGHLFGLWVTDRGPPVTRRDGILHGSKGPCSGAGHVTRALITVDGPDGTRMALLDPGSCPILPLSKVLTGMRASMNGVIQLDGHPLESSALFGQPGDYLREPMLSTGAWRTSAVTLGGLDALLTATASQLRQKGHADALLQQDRFGRLLIAQETARLWTERAALYSENAAIPVPDRVAYVNLARIAVETACLDAMQLVQRALGLAAFIKPNPVERILRDLSVYLRQPAPDAVLTEAGLHGLKRA